MNIIATSLIAGAVSAVPLSGLPAPANPFEGLSVSVAGIHVEIDKTGLTAQAAENRDISVELRLTSGTPIRVRL